MATNNDIAIGIYIAIIIILLLVSVVLYSFENSYYKLTLGLAGALIIIPNYQHVPQVLTALANA
jgi:hypothetical protein